MFSGLRERNGFRRVMTLGAGAVLVAGAAMSGGCNNALEGGLSGAGLGAGAGAIIGSLYGGAGTGAAIGAVAGGLGGAIIGDQNERNRSQSRSYYSNSYEPRYYYEARPTYYEVYEYRTYSRPHCHW
jgi:hypothetical protein